MRRFAVQAPALVFALATSAACSWGAAEDEPIYPIFAGADAVRYLAEYQCAASVTLERSVTTILRRHPSAELLHMARATDGCPFHIIVIANVAGPSQRLLLAHPNCPDLVVEAKSTPVGGPQREKDDLVTGPLCVQKAAQ